MIFGLLAAAFVVCLPILAVTALSYTPRKPQRDRSARSVAPFAFGCFILILLGLGALIYFAHVSP